MGIKIKNLQTGEFEKFNIPALKGEKGEPGEVEPSEKVDYIGKQHSKLRDTMNANVDYIIKTAIGEFNYLDYEGQHITATNSIEGHAKSAILKGNTLVNVLGYKALKNSNEGASYTYDGKYLTNPNATDHSPWNNMKSVSNLIKPNTNYFVMLYNPSSVEVRTQMTFLNSADATKENFNISLGERVSYKVVSPSNANG